MGHFDFEITQAVAAGHWEWLLLALAAGLAVGWISVPSETLKQ